MSAYEFRKGSDHPIYYKDSTYERTPLRGKDSTFDASPPQGPGTLKRGEGRHTPTLVPAPVPAPHAAGEPPPPPVPPRPRQPFGLMCKVCGQLHDPDGNHLYDYQQAVDEDLSCQVCLQPLVDPVDTKCGHTFCMLCIKNYLNVQQVCPLDRKVLALSDVQQSSIMVRRLLDKLLIVCPNVDYCEEVLPRCDLEAHLTHRCKGAVTSCLKADLGCTFQGPRSALQSHLWECEYRDVRTGSPALSRLPVVEGDVSTIDIQRGCYDLGISIVGGIDTPLMCMVIQEVFPDSVVAKDARLQPGDQLLEVNGVDLSNCSHAEARGALHQVYPICRLTVYREKAEEQGPVEREEIIKVSLPKVPGRQLGIKLVSKKAEEGLFILEMVPGGLATVDSRLRKDDRILEINCQDMTRGTQDQAAHIIQASVDKVQVVVCRKMRPCTPDIIRSTSRECLLNCTLPVSNHVYASLKPCREKHLTVHKDPMESLGISVAGGYGNPRGDIPIYITNMQETGCMGRTKQIKKGDILLSINNQSLLDLPHPEAVRVLKCYAESKVVTLKVLEGTETCDGLGNFTPSWKFWLGMPVVCHIVRSVGLERAPSGTLGFSIVGGSDSGHGPVPIFVKSVVPNTPAGRDSRLRSGDMLLCVNGQTLENVAHSQAVAALKGAKGPVTLKVVSWPGTPV